MWKTAKNRIYTKTIRKKRENLNSENFEMQKWNVARILRMMFRTHKFPFFVDFCTIFVRKLKDFISLKKSK